MILQAKQCPSKPCEHSNWSPNATEKFSSRVGQQLDQMLNSINFSCAIRISPETRWKLYRVLYGPIKILEMQMKSNWLDTAQGKIEYVKEQQWQCIYWIEYVKEQQWQCIYWIENPSYVTLIILDVQDVSNMASKQRDFHVIEKKT